MTHLVLARHGETDWNRDGIWQGHGDPPLNELGRRQAALLATRVAGEDVCALYSSDLRRALETAESVAAMTGLSVVQDPRIREMDVGSWTGLSWEQIEARFPGSSEHDGESRVVFEERVISATREIASAHSDGERVVIVTHGGVVRALQRHVLGQALPLLENGATYGLLYENGAFARVD